MTRCAAGNVARVWRLRRFLDFLRRRRELTPEEFRRAQVLEPVRRRR